MTQIVVTVTATGDADAVAFAKTKDYIAAHLTQPPSGGSAWVTETDEVAYRLTSTHTQQVTL